MKKPPTSTKLTAPGVSRREAILAGGAAALSAAVVGCGQAATGHSQSPKHTSRSRSGKPRNVILMVSDGMSMGVPSMAETFSQLVRGRSTRWYELLRDSTCTHGLSETRSLSSVVTDSAAAGSAWGSGVRVNNGTLNMLPDGTKLRPIMRMLKDRGIATGLVTTDRVVGATPSGFVAVQEKRNDYPKIAPQFPGNVDVVLGGGRECFDPLARTDGRDIIGMFRDGGYQYVDSRSQVLAGKAGARVVGLFCEGKMPYTVDHLHSPELRRNIPTLTEMADLALESLSARPDGFFMMIEGARIDHAAHVNDAGAIVWEQLAFDDALASVENFARDRGDTLVIATSDHGNGNPGLNGTGDRYGGSPEAFANLAKAKGSFEAIARTVRAAGGKPSGPTVQSLVEEVIGIRVSDHEAEAVAMAFDDAGKVELHRQHRNWVGVLGQVLGNYNTVGWTGISHTNDHVLLTALGPGSEQFTGIHHHTDVFEAIADIFGITERNPSAADVAEAKFRKPAGSPA